MFSTCYDFSSIDQFLKLTNVVTELGISSKWQNCNVKIPEPISFDLGDMSDRVSHLLENNIKVLVYYGDQNYMYNYLGGELSINQVNWTHSQEFMNAPYSDFKIGTTTLGSYKQVRNLAFIKAYNAGHL